MSINGIEAEHEGETIAAIMADGLTEVIEELHAIDPVDLVSFIHFDRYAALEDLLQSSTELFFREGTLTFGWTAAVDMAWGDVPTVTLGMEFNNKAVSVFFNLSLRAMGQAVEIGSILFDPTCHGAGERAARLAEAIADAHLPKRIATPSRWSVAHPRDGRPLKAR